MTWAYSFQTQELLFCIAFGLLYLVFIVRTQKAARVLQVPYYRIVGKLILRLAYFTLFLIALLGPSFGDSKKDVKAIGKDIFLCVDLSESMNATDVQPSRLEKVKFEMKNLVESFSSDRKGVIMFGSEAFMQCPLTFDNNALGLFIQTMNTSLVPNSGTDFGPPLRMALDKLKQDASNSTTRQSSKVIILISDGEDFGEETSQVAEEIEKEGIKLFTLGIGSEQGSKIPTRRGFKKDNQGNEVVSRLNPQSLKKLASQTNGKYFEISSETNDINRLITTINLIEGELRDSRQMDVKANKYYYFLLVGFILFLFDVLVPIRLLKI